MTVWQPRMNTYGTPQLELVALASTRVSAPVRSSIRATSTSCGLGSPQRNSVSSQFVQARSSTTSADGVRLLGASAEIRQALIDLRDAGVAVLLVSEELEELFEVCDKVAVMTQGRLSPVRAIRETDAEELGLLMGGSFVTSGQPPSFATRDPP